MLPNTTDSPSFACLKLSDALLTQLDRVQFTEPTPIQQHAIPPAIEGCDLVGIAQTGTGKTLAFGLPMLDRLLRSGESGLILAPTRELALQIEDELKKIASGLGLRTAVLIGGAPMNRQISDIRRDPQIIIATPGRLKDHLYQGTMSLRKVAVVVLDEADRMFDMGFAQIVREILDKTPTNRQTMLFSATMPPEIVDLTSQYLQNPVRIEIAPQGTPSDLVEQEMVIVEHANKGDMLADVLYTYRGTVLVFSRTRHGARKIAKSIRDLGHSAAELHADKTLAQRKAALFGFKSGQHRILVATDIAARGIDVKDIELVVNYELPDHLEDYVHRIGRTGRAGSMGKAITFVLPSQKHDIRKLERIIGKDIPVIVGGVAEKRAPMVMDGDKPARPARPRADRNDRGPRPIRNDRPSRPYQSDRPARPESNDRPAPQNRDERPAWQQRSNSDRPFQGNRNDRPAPQNRNDRPAWQDRSNSNDRPFQQNRDNRPSGPQNRNDRPAWQDRSNSNDRPFQRRDDRPRGPQDRSERPAWQDRSNSTDRPVNNDRPQGQDRPAGPKDRTAKPRWDRSTNGSNPPTKKPFHTKSSDCRPGGNSPAQHGRPKPSGTPKAFKKKSGQSFIKNPGSAPGKKFGRK